MQLKINQLAFFLCFLSVGLAAQNQPKDSSDVRASLALTGFYQSGNVKTFIFRAKSEVNVRLLKHIDFATTNSYVYQEFGEVKADEDFLSLNFININPKASIHPFVLGFFSTNFRRRIDYRYLVGAGITFNLLKSEKMFLKASLSSEYENTSFNEFGFNRTKYNGSESINTVRGTFWVKGRYKLFKDKIVLIHESYFQPSLQDSDNYRWQADIGFELPTWKWLNFKINYLHTFESIVIAGQKQQDKFLTLGFTLKNF